MDVDTIKGWFLGLLFTAASVVVCLYSIHSLVRATGSSQWPTATARIYESRVSCTSDSDDGETCRPLVRYQYSLDDRSYHGHSIHYFEHSYSRSLLNWEIKDDVERVLADYPDGGTVTVYYCPDDPSVSVLVPGIYEGSLFAPVVLIIAIIGSTLVLTLIVIMLFRKTPDDEESSDD